MGVSKRFEHQVGCFVRHQVGCWRTTTGSPTTPSLKPNLKKAAVLQNLRKPKPDKLKRNVVILALVKLPLKGNKSDYFSPV